MHRMPKLIGFAGLKGAGKDTCADFLVLDKGFIKQAFATPVKQICRELFMLSDAQLWGNQKDMIDSRYNQTSRQLLQKFGTDFCRNQVSQNFWVDRFASWYRTQTQPVVLCDVRFQNEVDLVHTLGGKVYLIQRTDVPPSKDYHSSENVNILVGLSGLIINNGDYFHLRDRVLDVTES